jgi:flagellar hook-associated protein 1 FlgK
MSLSSTLSLAQSALANNAAQSAILSSNIANVNNANYARRSAGAITQTSGSVTLGSTQRATDSALLASLLTAQSQSASSTALSTGLTNIANTLSIDTANTTASSAASDQSPATLIGTLTNALQQYAAQPDNASLATAAISAATALSTNLNQSSLTVQGVRETADKDIAASVSTINSLLAQFQTVNDSITKGTATGGDVSDALDTRDGILKQLSNEVGITTVPTSNNGLSIYTDSGVTLFNVTPRTVSFTPTATYAAGTVGQAVSVDGVPVTGASAVMPISSGALAGLTTLRDTSAVAYQNQLDQIAASLVTTFAESPTSGTPATLPGLFTSPTLGGSLPTAGTTTGLAGLITVNANVNPATGGTATLLRDGNISGSSYNQNTTNAAAFSDRLTAMVAALSQTQSFDPSSGGTAAGTVATYAQSSVSWLEATRQAATNDATYKTTVVNTTTTALSNSTGVNLDDEMSKMLDIEHAYQASAQLLNTVSSMYSSLLQAFQ